MNTTTSFSASLASPPTNPLPALGEAALSQVTDDLKLSVHLASETPPSLVLPSVSWFLASSKSLSMPSLPPVSLYMKCLTSGSFLFSFHTLLMWSYPVPQ